MKKLSQLATIFFLSLILLSTFFVQVFSWSNGGYSETPLIPDYGTHDWIAEHALDWLPQNEKEFIANNLISYLYGTELPDNPNPEDGIGDTAKHHIYFNSDESLADDSAAVRAQEEYNKVLDFLQLEDYVNASKTLGIMTHYIVDMSVFGHVMGTSTDWGTESHHSDYENYVNTRTNKYTDEFNGYLSFDGSLDNITAYDAAKELAFDTTFDKTGDLTCVWMDDNYFWGPATFGPRCGESLNLAVNLVTDVIHTIYLQSQQNINNGPGTEVAGILWDNTTWTAENSPYVITETIQIPENVTLTIEPGVTVTCPITDEMFLVGGRINATGTISNKIILDGGGTSDFFENAPGNSFVNMKYCIIREGQSFGWPGIPFNLTYSEIINVNGRPTNLLMPGPMYIEHNTFRNWGGIMGWIGPKDVHIRHNLFVGNPDGQLIRYMVSEGFDVECNSFIEMNGSVLYLVPSCGNVTASNNYWGTTNTTIIDSMIYDTYDDITCQGFIDYQPILTEPHPDTPTSTEVIPEFSAFILLSFLLVFTSLGVFVRRKFSVF